MKFFCVQMAEKNFLSPKNMSDKKTKKREFFYKVGWFLSSQKNQTSSTNA